MADSWAAFIRKRSLKGLGRIPMTFIAPHRRSGRGRRDSAETGGHIVAARQENQLVTAFHPELSDVSSRVHRYFREILPDEIFNGFIGGHGFLIIQENSLGPPYWAEGVKLEVFPVKEKGDATVIAGRHGVLVTRMSFCGNGLSR